MLKRLPSEKQVLTDEKTGNTVWRMTNDASKNVSCYQEVEAFTSDDRFVVFSSDRTGSFQLYRAELESGEIAQLSDVDEFNVISFAVAGNGYEAIYTAGWRIYAVNVCTGETRVLVDFEGKLLSKPSGGTVALSGTGDRLLVSCRSESKADILAFIFIETGEYREIFEWEGNLSHEQICPGDDNLITFDPLPDKQNELSLPQTERARTWILDVEKGEARPFLIAPPGFRATHEYWDFLGERLYFHTKSVPGWTPATISSINRDGEDWQDHFKSPNRKLGHSSINRASTFIIADVQDTEENELWRIDLKTGKGEVLCWPNTSPLMDQTIHAHPSISPSGEYVDFTSDRCGSSDLYVFPLKQPGGVSQPERSSR